MGGTDEDWSSDLMVELAPLTLELDESTRGLSCYRTHFSSAADNFESCYSYSRCGVEFPIPMGHVSRS